MSGEVTIDLTGYKDRVGQKVDPGRYLVVVDDAELDTSKAGNQMVNIWLRVADGIYAGSVIIDRLVITDKSLFRVVGFMQAVGLPTPKKKFRLNVRQFIGRSLLVDIEDGEPYNGRVKSEVRGYMRALDTAQEQEAGDELGAAMDAATGRIDPGAQESPLDLAEVFAGAVVADDTSTGSPVDLDSLDLG